MGFNDVKETLYGKYAGKTVTRRLLHSLLHDIFSEIIRATHVSNKVCLPKLGTFLLVKVRRRGHNPSTGQSMGIIRYRTVSFRPSKEFKRVINKR